MSNFDQRMPFVTRGAPLFSIGSDGMEGVRSAKGRNFGIQNVISILLFLAVLAVAAGMVTGLIDPNSVFEAVRIVIVKAGSIVAGLFGS
jgi:hypothetical protein